MPVKRKFAAENLVKIKIIMKSVFFRTVVFFALPFIPLLQSGERAFRHPLSVIPRLRAPFPCGNGNGLQATLPPLQSGVWSFKNPSMDF